MPTYTTTKTKAKSSIKSLSAELANLNPSAVVTLFEIDVSNIMENQNIPNLSTEADAYGLPKNVDDNVFRFHNNIKLVDTFIWWRGKQYSPSPIQATGFETNTRGTLPTPELTIAAQGEEGITLMGLLRYEIRKFGDIIGAKVTRIRTFAKYLDTKNFVQKSLAEDSQQLATENFGEIPQGFEPDPYAELPRDIYYVERKITENKSVLNYQLSSALDLEGITIPKRIILADRCMWQYRGPGCWYQHLENEEEKKVVSQLWTNSSGEGNWSNAATSRTQIIAKGAAPNGAKNITVDPINTILYTGYVLNFTSGATFTVGDNYSSSATITSQYPAGSEDLFGELDGGAIADDETATINYSYNTLTSAAGNASIASAIRTSSPSNVNFSIAHSPRFTAKRGDVFQLQFIYTHVSGTYFPTLQIINYNDISGKVGWKQSWSNRETIGQQGTVTLEFTVSDNAPLQSNTATNNAIFQIFNTQEGSWEISNVLLNKMGNTIPIMDKAQLNQEAALTLLPSIAPPVATDDDERVINAIVDLKKSQLQPLGRWKKGIPYNKGEYVFVEKDKIKYYYVAKEDGVTAAPPNSTYWVADQCSKSLTGCRMRWGVKGAFVKNDKGAGSQCVIGGSASGTTGGLPFGGFPAARKVQTQFTGS